jgi:hypothetical protein
VQALPLRALARRQFNQAGQEARQGLSRACGGDQQGAAALLGQFQQGELVGVSQTTGTDFAVDPEPADGSELNADDIRNQLFNAENVVLNPDQSDRGLSKLTHPPTASTTAADFEEVD